MTETQTMRTRQEVVERVKTSKSFFGFDTEVLLMYLPFEEAKEFFKPEFQNEKARKEWDADGCPFPLTRETVIAEISSYMPFAIEKATDHRGISANRSVEKMEAWVWLLGEEKEIAWDLYAQYGAPVLLAVCQRYGIDLPEHRRHRDDPRFETYDPWCTRCAFDRMAQGFPCRDGCEEGCSR